MILLSKPALMKKVIMAYPPEYGSLVLSFLQESGIVDIEPYEPGRILEEYENLKKLREQIYSIMEKSGVEVVRTSLLGAEATMLSIEKIRSDVSDIIAQVEVLESQIGELGKKLDELVLLSNLLKKLPSHLDPRALFYKGKRISSLLVVCKKEYIERLTKHEYVKAFEIYEFTEDLSAVVAIVEASHFDAFLELTRSLNAWYSKALVELVEKCEDFKCLIELVDREITSTERELEKLKTRLVDVAQSNLEKLGKYLLYVENELSKYEVFRRVIGYKHLVGLQGWIPADRASDLIGKIENNGIPVYIELRDPEPHDNPPSLMKNLPVIKFYQVVTRLYGVPGYREWDPTPLVAYSFALFFGLMNADAGYALLGVLVALLILDRMVENPDSPHYREFKGALTVSNIIALALGVLSGTFFGDLLHLFGFSLPVVVRELVNPLDFIKLSLVIGLVHVNVAHILALVKSYRERKLGDFTTELGLIVGQVFGIPLVLDLFLRYKVPLISSLPGWALQAGTFVGLLLIVTGSLINMRALGMLMWLFQITGVLGDVLSYVRLAGVGMATYYMAMAFNYMAGMIINYFRDAYVLGVIAAFPVLVLAHLMVFVLAQLGAFVHSLRLCMLEFLTKFYEGYGREYSPFKVVRSSVIVLRR